MKLAVLLKAKIHRLTVTGADLNYEGSVGIDADLMERVSIVSGEQVSIWNVTNGSRLETYAIPLPRLTGDVILNGAAARHCQPGDTIIIAAFCLSDEPVEPRMIAVDDRNRFTHVLAPATWPCQ